ncbi:MAG: esterase-like activity of phytase family protein, partial [Proteobacteria bacterium]|nr:esterase-like activity of phytase family protein [Pseudomonadota bacterium]
METAESAIVVKSELIAAFEPGNPSRKRFGGLEFRGGLVLTSPSPVFGGLSALRVSADGDLVAVTDHGNWLTARLVYDGSRPVGLTNAVMAPILGADGRPLAARGWYDTESLTADDGTFYIGIERVHQIVRLDFARDGIHARAQPIAVPAAFARLPDNKGIECLAFVPRPHSLHGTLIAISERGLDASGNIQGFLIGGPKPGEFTVRRRDDFDISDCALAPDGALFLLERKFSWATGVQIRIRRVNIADVAPGALVDGREILNADMTFQIDNMEGLSLHRAKDGRVIMTVEKRLRGFHQLALRRINLDGGDYHPLFGQRGSVGYHAVSQVVQLAD